MVEGSLRNDSWEKDGVKHSTMKVRVNNFAPIVKGQGAVLKKKNVEPESVNQEAESVEDTVAF